MQRAALVDYLLSYLYWKCVKKGDKEGDTWRMLTVPGQGLRGQGYFYVMNDHDKLQGRYYDISGCYFV